jgi:hypothetical protein
MGNCKSALGVGCTAGSQCASGFCSIDGVCCGQLCNASCQECASQNGSVCVPVFNKQGPGCMGAGQSCDSMGHCN